MSKRPRVANEGTDVAMMAPVPLNCSYAASEYKNRTALTMSPERQTVYLPMFNEGSNEDFDAVAGEGAWCPQSNRDEDGQQGLNCITSFNKVHINAAAIPPLEPVVAVMKPGSRHADPTIVELAPFDTRDETDPEGRVKTIVTGVNTSLPDYKAWRNWTHYRQLQREWRFVGIVLTPYIRFQDVRATGRTDNTPRMVVLIQGTISICNTSHLPITAMDHIRATLPGKPRNKDFEPTRTALPIAKDGSGESTNGISGSKVTTIFEAVKPHMMLMNVMAIMQARGLGGIRYDKDSRSMFDTLFQHERENIIGIALRSARTGHRFDIHLTRPS